MFIEHYNYSFHQEIRIKEWEKIFLVLGVFMV